MKQLSHAGFAAISVATLLTISACGGGGSSPPPPPPPPPASTDVLTRVVDGAIKNATVCLDKNGNGLCDAGEPQGKTDVNGNVTLSVPNADVGKFPLVAIVGTDATDADTGAVPVSFSLSTPADSTAVISPLTSLVQQFKSRAGLNTDQAAKAVRDSLGLSASVLADYTKVAAPTDGTPAPAVLARLLVLAAQKQTAALAPAVGTNAIDGKPISQADVDKTAQTSVVAMLAQIASAVSDPTIKDAATAAAREAALATKAQSLVSSSGISASGAAITIAADRQTPVAESTGNAGFNIRSLSYFDINNYTLRSFNATTTQATPDAGGFVRYTEQRRRASGGPIAKWSSGGDPQRNSDLHWTGSAWATCPLNFESKQTVRDATGRSTYNYCNSAETGSNQRSQFDISGKKMIEVYNQLRSANYNGFNINNAPVALSTPVGDAVFPTGSTLSIVSSIFDYQAISYYPGASRPAGASNVVTIYSSAVSNGGNAAAQPAGTLCNSPEAAGFGSNATTLEAIVASKTGTPCVYGQGSLTDSSGNIVKSDIPNEWWGNSTVNLGIIGTAPLSPAVLTSYYTGNILLRAAFKGSGANAVTYYKCREKATTGGARNCTVVGAGTYAIQTLGDARVLTFSNLPVDTAPLNYNRVLVERGGKIYNGYQNKVGTITTARLTSIAANALLTQLGIPNLDPAAPFSLSRTSYQGGWNIYGATDTSDGINSGLQIYLAPNGPTSCSNRNTKLIESCTLNITNFADGTFSVTFTGGSIAGKFNFMTGSVDGVATITETSPPADVPVVGERI